MLDLNRVYLCRHIIRVTWLIKAPNTVIGLIIMSAGGTDEAQEVGIHIYFFTSYHHFTILCP